MKTVSDKPINMDTLQIEPEVETVNFYSDVMKNIYKNIVELAQNGSNIVLVGEQGVGKHRIAKLIHTLSQFSEGPFSNLYCNSLEETINEQAPELERILAEEGIYTHNEAFGMNFFTGGTLFLNSFYELSPSNREMLIKLLFNAQQTSTYSKQIPFFRLIFSIVEKPGMKVTNSFTWNELIRIFKPTVIHIPPLRERCEDITLLIDQFLIDYATKNNTPIHAISFRTAYKCISYHWPGNIRQLKNTIEHAATVVQPGTVITSEKLPFSIDWKSPTSPANNYAEHNKSFVRAERLLFNKIVTKSNLNRKELKKIEYEFRITFKNE